MTVTTSRDHLPVRVPEDLLTRGRLVVEPVLRAAVDGLPEPLRGMAGYHLGWWEDRGRPTAVGKAKMLRPALTVAAAVACGGDPAVSAGAGAAVELLHNFTLIHDDVIDADDARRGRPTVWRVWGVNDAMLLGDALHALSFRFLVQGGIPKVEGLVARLVDTAVELCRGQSEDCRFETCASVGLVEYVAMAMGKTGSLMGCACALGALCAEADSATVAALDRFGRQLGLAFQFVDDALGIWGDPAVTGKPVGSDLARRKRSLPVVAALVSDTDAGRELAELYASEVPLGSAEVLRASELIAAAGGRELALGYADRHAAAAVMALPRSLATDDLTRLAYHVAHRDR